MSKNIYAKAYLTGELNKTTCYQAFVPDESYSILACRVRIVLYNAPVFTNLKAQLCGDRSGVPAGVITTSTNVYNIADISVENNAIKELYFTFMATNVRAGVTYHLALTSDTYTGTDSSHIAWEQPLYGPVYATSGARSAVEVRHLGTWPQFLSFIAAEAQ